MESFIKHFVRERDEWVCIETATWVGPPRVQVIPGTRFRRGEMFMGVDIAKLLDDQDDRDRRARSDKG
jgi:hypothetical protein